MDMIKQEGNIEDKDLTCIHWGYLNILQLSDVSGKKIKNPSWHTYWTDLCGPTIRLYKDISLPENNGAFPPATVVGPRPENQVKYAFFSLKDGSIKDYDAAENSPRLKRKQKLARKHVLQIVLANFSVYYLQAPTMSAFYRWRTKIQSSIDNADIPEKFYEKQLRDAKMAIYEQQRCFFKPAPIFPDVVDQDTEDEETVRPAIPSRDPRVLALKEKLLEKRRLLNQLEKQEKDFLGTDKDNQCTIKRIEFSATAKKNYYLVVGRHDTLLPEGQTFTVFGRLPNGRWRCFVDREDGVGSSQDSNGQQCNSYPLIGSVPTSIIVELNQASRIKDLVDNISLSSNELSPPGTPADDISTTSTSSFTFDVIPPPSPQSSRRSPEPYSNHKPASNPTAQKNQPPTGDQSPPPSRPTRIAPGKPDQKFNFRITRASESSISPTTPGAETPTQMVSNAITDLNRALESLAALTPRPRVSSEVSTCSRTSTSSQEDESSDLSRGSRIELVSDDDPASLTRSADTVVRRRKRRDIHISRKLHAKGISLVVGSSSSSEDEDDFEDIKKALETIEKPKVKSDTIQSRKIEGLQSSKEKLTEKVSKGLKSSQEGTSKLPNGDRSAVDKPTTSTDLLREFSENGCFGLPIRNSVTQAQFKPLASHEIPPPLHQRRTLQMTRKENEGFGFVLQTNMIVQTGAYSDAMTFVSNVSEDGPAYLAGMRPGDVIIEVENVAVEDDDHQMIVESLRNAGLTIRLVVVYKDAVQRMRLSTKLLALKARLGEAEDAYDALVMKEKMLLDRVKDTPVLDAKVRVAVIYIHIQIASTTFARDTPEIKNSVVQTKRTPSELLRVNQTQDAARKCGAPTTGYELVREFATTCETQDGLESEHKTTSPKYASDTALNISKKRKANEGSSKSKTLKHCQRSSFISYVNFDTDSSSPTSRRRVKSDGYDPDDTSKLSSIVDEIDELPPMAKTLPVQSRVTRPESYMFALGSQNAIDSSLFKDLPQSKIDESSEEDGVV